MEEVLILKEWEEGLQMKEGVVVVGPEKEEVVVVVPEKEVVVVVGPEKEVVEPEKEVVVVVGAEKEEVEEGEPLKEEDLILSLLRKSH